MKRASQEERQAKRQYQGRVARVKMFPLPSPQMATVSYNYPPMSGGTKPNPAMLRAYRTGGGVGKAADVGYVDLAQAVYALNTTGSITLIATVAQGAGTTQRVGKRIQWKSIEGRGFISSDSTTLTAYTRFMIVYDQRPTGVLPNITDILNTANAHSFNNDDNSQRFIILKNQSDTVNGNNTTAGQVTNGSSFPIDFYLKLTKKNLISCFKSVGSGAIGDIEEGALYLVTVGSVVAGTADANLSIGIRTRFYDI